MQNIHTEQVLNPIVGTQLAKDQPLVLLSMFKALGHPEENVDKKRKKNEGREERRKKEGRTNGQMRENKNSSLCCFNSWIL